MRNNQIIERLEKELEERKSNNSFRILRRKSALSDFSSNDYLGLGKTVVSASGNVGSGGSRLLSGNTAAHEEVEDLIADFHNSDAALIFNSGYTTNLGFFSTIPKKGEVIIYDELIHASIRDGIRLSTARNFSFKHNDIEDLKSKIERLEEPFYVVIESLYSMDGDFAPLIDLADLCTETGGMLIVDEAHSVGLFGEKGEGLVSKYDLENEVFARIVTYGKAFGFHGASVLGSQLIKDYLINYCRSFIYTTAPSIHDVGVLYKQYKNVESAGELRQKLFSNIQLFKSLIGNHQDDYLSPIQTVMIPGNDLVKQKSEELQKKGFDVRPVMSPTVPKGQERLRICIHSYNSEQEIRGLVDLLKGTYPVLTVDIN